MDNKEKKLSDYIDELNNEKIPKEHYSEERDEDLDELYETVRMVKSLKEPVFPEEGFIKILSDNVNLELKDKKSSKKSKKGLLYGVASVAAAAAILIAFNVTTRSSRNNMVYAMEQAFTDVKAYHGVLEVVTTNALGKSTMQSKMEVWADKEGRYYVKGLEGWQKDLITVNNGKQKWQVQPKEKEVEVFSAFPDSYSFTFEIGEEIEDAKRALKTKVIGEEKVAGRDASVMEVTPDGGNTYKIWIDKETKMPLQKQSSMDYSIQYTVRYTDIDFAEEVPSNLLSFSLPSGFKEVNANNEQVVNSLEEAYKIAGFTPKIAENIPDSYKMDNISVVNDKSIVRIDYVSKNNKKVSVFQGKSSGGFKPSSMAVIGKVNDSNAEIQCPVQESLGVLESIALNGEYLDAASIRWVQDGFEFGVIGDDFDKVKSFAKELSGKDVEIPDTLQRDSFTPEVSVPVDLEAEKNSQKNVDDGHSPWKLDPVFVSQVFVSLKIYPEGINGDYPIDYEKFNMIKNTGKEAVIEVESDITPIKRVYLKRLIRQDSSGIWTIVGYDPAK